MFVGLSAHSFATIEIFQWFSKLPLNGMVEGNHWDQWFSDGFGVRQPLVTLVFDGCAPLVYHRRSLERRVVLQKSFGREHKVRLVGKVYWKLLEKLEKFSGKVCDEKTGWFELWGNPGTSQPRLSQARMQAFGELVLKIVAINITSGFQLLSDFSLLGFACRVQCAVRICAECFACTVNCALCICGSVDLCICAVANW